MEHERLKFPNKGLNYFVSVLESKGKTKRAMESLHWARNMFTNHPATTKSINLHISPWLTRITETTNSCGFLKVFVERLFTFFFFLKLFFFFFSFSGFGFNMWGMCLFKKRKLHTTGCGERSRFLQSSFCEHSGVGTTRARPAGEARRLAGGAVCPAAELEACLWCAPAAGVGLQAARWVLPCHGAVRAQPPPGLRGQLRGWGMARQAVGAEAGATRRSTARGGQPRAPALRQHQSFCLCSTRELGPVLSWEVKNWL